MWLQSIVGISVVFLALVALYVFILLFGKFMKNGEDRSVKRKAEKDKAPGLEKPLTGVEITAESDEDDMDEIIAVITAAVKAAVAGSGITPECRIKVRSFKRVSSESPVWHEAGRKELLN